MQIILTAIAAAMVWAASAQEKAPETTPVRAQPAQADLEKKLEEQLTNCEFVGRWTLVKDGKLGEEKEEKYTIQSARKAGQELWIIHARVQYGQRDVTVPIPVQIKWAGDTPVITLTESNIAGLGTYSARVVIYQGTYAGTWSGGNHAGLLHGIIRKKEKE